MTVRHLNQIELAARWNISHRTLERWRWSGSLRARVRTLVGTHLALGYLLHGPRDARARWRWRPASPRACSTPPMSSSSPPAAPQALVSPSSHTCSAPR